MHEAPGAWPLIGRADALDRVVAKLTTGGGLVVTGRAGEGKTRLLAAARDRAAASGGGVARACGRKEPTARTPPRASASRPRRSAAASARWPSTTRTCSTLPRW